MPINLTPAAEKEVLRILESQNKVGWGLRVGVKDGGCSGMSYHLSVEEHSQANDHVFECGAVKVFCDPVSYLFLNGLVIDYSNALLNGGFKFTNPLAQRTCSCGTSFSTGKSQPLASNSTSCCS